MEIERRYTSVTIWKIENFRYCWHKVNKYLKSELFNISRLHDSWHLRLYPRGLKDTEDFIGIYLRRVAKEPKFLTADYEFSVLDSDGKPQLTQKETNTAFSKKHLFGIQKFLGRQYVIGTDESTLLPGGTLTVKCCISWKASEDIEIDEAANTVLKSGVLFSRHLFIWDAGEFNYLSPSKVGTFSKRTVDYSELSLKLNSDSINIHIELKGNTRMFRFRIGILDSRKSDPQFLIDEYMFSPETSLETSLIERSKLLLGKDLYLSTGRLMLRVECHYPSEIYTEDEPSEMCNEVEGTSYDVDFLPDVKKNPEKRSRCCDNNYDSMRNDFHSLYQEGTVADFRIIVGSVTLRAHKAVLYARSSYFKHILAQPEVNQADLSNFDRSIVESILTFMYTDKIENLDWNMAIDLYARADHFGLPMLKSECVETLKRLLITANDDEIQNLADTHPDADLKKVASEYLRQKKGEASTSLEHLPTHSQNPS